jgi:hypothetical protein
MMMSLDLLGQEQQNLELQVITLWNRFLIKKARQQLKNLEEAKGRITTWLNGKVKSLTKVEEFVPKSSLDSLQGSLRLVSMVTQFLMKCCNMFRATQMVTISSKSGKMKSPSTKTRPTIGHSSRQYQR